MDISKLSQVAVSANVDAARPVTAGREISDTGLTPAQRVSEVSQSNKSEAQSLENAVSKLNEYVQIVRRSIQFEIDDLTGREIVKVLDRDTDELIRQIPTEEVLNFARQLAEQNQSDDFFLFSDKA